MKKVIIALAALIAVSSVFASNIFDQIKVAEAKNCKKHVQWLFKGFDNLNELVEACDSIKYREQFLCVIAAGDDGDLPATEVTECSTLSRFEQTRCIERELKYSGTVDVEDIKWCVERY